MNWFCAKYIETIYHHAVQQCIRIFDEFDRYFFVELDFEREECAIVKEQSAVVLFQVHPRLGQVVQSGHVAGWFIHRLHVERTLYIMKLMTRLSRYEYECCSCLYMLRTDG